jgi:hypothetical protein
MARLVNELPREWAVKTEQGIARADAGRPLAEMGLNAKGRAP